MRKYVLSALLVTSIALAAASVAAGAAENTVLRISAQKTALRYNVTKLKATAGKVTISMTNPSPIFKHNVAIRGNGVRKTGAIVGKGGVSKVVLTLKPGRYTFYCTVPGHEKAGMKGTLAVTR